MLLRYVDNEGRQIEAELGKGAITIGRAPDADISIQGEKISRYHCGVRFWDGEFVLKDLKSTNGTFLNERPVSVAVLNPGDVIRVGGVRLYADEKAGKGTRTILREVGEAIEEGKGYRTILREIVESTEEKKSQDGPG